MLAKISLSKLYSFRNELPHDKTSKMTCAPSEDSDQLGHPPPVWSKSSLCIKWIAKDQNLLQAENQDADQTAQMHKLIWVFAGRTGNFVGYVMLWLKFEVWDEIFQFLLVKYLAQPDASFSQIAVTA